MSSVAFVGLGKMGSGMARRLLAAGRLVQVYNRSPEPSRSLAREGAQACATPREAGRGAGAVFVMVADDTASRAVWQGPDGILAAELAPGAFAVECSTLSHAWVLELARAARARGLRYVDAPVTGLPAQAANGTLTLLVGAAEADLAAARPLLETLSSRILRFGDVGAGTAYKLVINLVGAVQIASIAETIALAERAGLDLHVVASALATSQAASPQVLRNAERMFAGDHASNVVFTPALRLKDVEYALRLARSLGIGSPFGALAETTFRALCDAGHAAENESSVIEIARRRK